MAGKAKPKPSAAASFFAAADEGAEVNVDLGQGAPAFRIKRLTTGEHSACVEAATTQETDPEDGGLITGLDIVDLTARMIVASAVEPALTEDDLPAVKALRMDWLRGLAVAVRQHSRLDADVPGLVAAFREEPSAPEAHVAGAEVGRSAA